MSIFENNLLGLIEIVIWFFKRMILIFGARFFFSDLQIFNLHLSFDI